MITGTDNQAIDSIHEKISQQKIIIDSEMSFEEAVQGSKAPQVILDNQMLLNVQYFGFDSLVHHGQLVVHRDLASEVDAIFDTLFQIRFPIEKVIPIVLYDWSDSLSMAENNTSAFNYREVMGSDRLSMHAFGRAIDINPRYNPYYFHGRMLPENGLYDFDHIGTIADTSAVVSIFEARGWTWGGRWVSVKDYQHFQK